MGNLYSGLNEIFGNSNEKIKTISVNGTPVEIDENRNVDITVPAFDNEDILKKFSKDDNENLLYDGSSIKGEIPISEEDGNALEHKSDGLYVPSNGESSNITIDSTMSDTSENTVQNKVIKKYVDDKSNTINQNIKDLDDRVTELENGSTAIKLEEPTNIMLTNKDEAVALTWTDPEDIIISGETIAEWAGTLVVRKAGSAPTNKSDGTIVMDCTERNKYETTPLIDNGLTNGVEYFYGIFPYSKKNAWTISCVKSITPSNIYPSAATDISISSKDKSAVITFTLPEDATSVKIVYKADSEPTSPTDGTVVETSASPYTITGLTNDTTYYFTIYTYNSKERYTKSDTISCTPKAFKIVTFADGTDDEIKSMLEAHYNNEINIADYWSVGDMRTIHLDTMEAIGVSESHVAQDQQFVIIGIEHDDLETPINGKTKAAITIQQLRMLSNGTAYEPGYMNSSNTNSGGWEECARRTWCNNVFVNALPSSIQSLVKTVSKLNYKVYNSTNLTTTSDSAFLLSETEIFGANTYSVGNTEGIQYEYFKTYNNRLKYSGNATTQGSACDWWERSPRLSYATYFCCVNSAGSADSYIASSAYSLCPALCL